jgi:glutaconyl-CoA decarboxylase
MPGKILKVATSVGAVVKNGDILLILEAMKMENEILAGRGGTVKEIRVKDGDSVNTGDVLVVVG